MVRDSQGNLHSYATTKVNFTSQSGQQIEFAPDSIATNPPPYKEGQIVTVYYNPNHPQEAKVDSFASLWLSTKVAGFMGLTVFLLGLWSTKFRWSQNRKKDEFDIEEEKTTSSILKYFPTFFLLAITTIVYIGFKPMIKTQPLFIIPFLVVGLLSIVLMVKSFLEVFFSLKKTSKLFEQKIKQEKGGSSLVIKVKDYQHPLIFLYHFVIPFIGTLITAFVVYFCW